MTIFCYPFYKFVDSRPVEDRKPINRVWIMKYIVNWTHHNDPSVCPELSRNWEEVEALEQFSFYKKKKKRLLPKEVLLRKTRYLVASKDMIYWKPGGTSKRPSARVCNRQGGDMVRVECSRMYNQGLGQKLHGIDSLLQKFWCPA